MPTLPSGFDTYHPTLGPSSSFTLNFPDCHYTKGAPAINKWLQLYTKRSAAKNHLHFLHTILNDKEQALFQKLLKVAVKHFHADPRSFSTLNIMSNLRYGRQTHRVLMQYFPFASIPKSRYPHINGRFTSINHLENFGPTRIFLANPKKVLSTYTSDKFALPEQSDLKIKSKDLDVLRLKSKGLKSREIAKKLAISVFSVNSIVRDLKKDTGMELIPLIQHLKDLEVL